MDSIGKTAGSGSSRQYYREVVDELERLHQIRLVVRFLPSHGLEKLCQQAISDLADEFHFLLLLSFGNDLVTQAGHNVPDQQWLRRKPEVLGALARLRARLQGCPHEVVFGGVGSMWQIPNPEVFDARAEDIYQSGRDLHLSMTPASDWLQGLTRDCWMGFSL